MNVYTKFMAATTSKQMNIPVQHVETLQKKIRNSIYALYQIGMFSPYRVSKQAYFALTEAYLRHGITAWGNGPNCRVRLIEWLYKNYTRTRNYHNTNIRQQLI